MRPKIGSSYRYAHAYLLLLEEGDQRFLIEQAETIRTTYNRLLEDIKTHNLSLKNRHELILLWAYSWQIPYFGAWVALMLENNRLHDFSEIFACAHELYCVTHNIQNISIITSHTLNSEDREHLKESLPAQSIISYRKEKNLLGGMIVKIDGFLKDESMQARLHDVREFLMV